MNLKEFLQHRTHCVYCNKPLEISVNHSKKVTVDDNNRCEFGLQLKAIKRGHRSYLAVFNVDLDANLFTIDFKPLKKEEPALEYVPTHIINRLKEYVKNAKIYFYAKCADCEKYSYASDRFDLSFKDNVMPSFPMERETFNEFLLKNGKKSYLVNNFLQKTTQILYAANIYSSFQDAINLPLITFTTMEETTNRINNLLIFS